MVDKPVKLTKRQELFVAEYIACLNGAEAARRAGYSEKTARNAAAENMANPNIKALIDREFQARIMQPTEVLTRLSDIARSDIGEILDADDEFGLRILRERNMTRFIKSVKRRDSTDKDGNTTTITEYDLYSSAEALVNLGKYHALFTSKIQIETWQDRLIGALQKGQVSPEEVEAEIGTDAATQLFERGRILYGQNRKTPADVQLAQTDTRPALTALAPRPMEHRPALGQNQDGGDGEAMGQDDHGG